MLYGGGGSSDDDDGSEGLGERGDKGTTTPMQHRRKRPRTADSASAGAGVGAAAGEDTGPGESSEVASARQFYSRVDEMSLSDIFQVE
jgi:hypothetical protein